MQTIDYVIPELENMKKYPSTLFFKGDDTLLQRPKISIVGSREMSQYTQQMTYTLAASLAKSGVCVVSGGAMGVDTAAHRGAGSTNTIAVLPCGLDLYYPAFNRNMLMGIEHEGMTLSQFAPDMKAAKWSFVVRNELVVALGDVLVVSEAARNSGSMHSVAFAKKMGKKIYTFPHRAGESDGTMDLVKAGAAEVIYDIDLFVAQFGQAKAVEKDSFLLYCQNRPSYEEAIRKHGEKVSMYELEGKIVIKDGVVLLS